MEIFYELYGIAAFSGVNWVKMYIIELANTISDRVSTMRILICLITISLLALNGCGRSRKQVVVLDSPPAKKEQPKQPKEPKHHKQSNREHVEIQEFKPEAGREPKKRPLAGKPNIVPQQIEAAQKKKVFEFVDIGGRKYAVPKPWRGNKITQKSPPPSAMRQIPTEYTWNNDRIFIHRRACEQFVRMAESARQENVHLLAHSGFRSIGYQRKIFIDHMAAGRTWEDLVRYVAPPGYSEHMLGFSIDLYPSNWQFASTEAYHWLQEHGASFGFYETYPQDNSVGYPWEAWHWRFDGSIGSEKEPFSEKSSG